MEKMFESFGDNRWIVESNEEGGARCYTKQVLIQGLGDLSLANREMEEEEKVRGVNKCGVHSRYGTDEYVASIERGFYTTILN